jgi:hypothetical protein
LQPLNFRISTELGRSFKTYAARHDLKLNDLLVRSFDAYRVHCTLYPTAIPFCIALLIADGVFLSAFWGWPQEKRRHLLNTLIVRARSENPNRSKE